MTSSSNSLRRVILASRMALSAGIGIGIGVHAQTQSYRAFLEGEHLAE